MNECDRAQWYLFPGELRLCHLLIEILDQGIHHGNDTIALFRLLRETLGVAQLLHWIAAVGCNTGIQVPVSVDAAGTFVAFMLRREESNRWNMLEQHTCNIQPFAPKSVKPNISYHTNLSTAFWLVKIRWLKISSILGFSKKLILINDCSTKLNWCISIRSLKFCSIYRL